MRHIVQWIANAAINKTTAIQATLMRLVIYANEDNDLEHCEPRVAAHVFAGKYSRWPPHGQRSLRVEQIIERGFKTRDAEANN